MYEASLCSQGRREWEEARGRTGLDYSLGKTLNMILWKIWTLCSIFKLFFYILNSFQGEPRRLLNREEEGSQLCFEGIPKGRIRDH